MTQPTPLPHGISITGTAPSPEEHRHLRTIAGLSTPRLPTDSPLYAQALSSPYTAHVLTARLPPSSHPLSSSTSPPSDTQPQGKLVGMVRCVGDGVIFLQLVDMAVDPEYQGQGIGKALLDEMMKWIKEDEGASNAYTSLIGDAPGQKLYASRGFEATKGIGMKISDWSLRDGKG